MSKLSLKWFKKTTEKAIEKVVKSKLQELGEEEESIKKPYLTIKLTNDVLIVVLHDGNILTKPNATEDDFYAALNSNSEENLKRILSSSEVFETVIAEEKERSRIKFIQKGIKLLEELPDFIVENNIVYLAGTSRSMPQLLVEKFIEIVDRVSNEACETETIHEAINSDDEYLAHKNFFMWCCLNPRAEVANELYRFLQENSFRITKQGFFVALRNVVTLHGSPELVHFISNTYNKVKAVWKKNPKEYTIFLQPDNTYKLVHDSNLFKTETHTSTVCPECNGEGVIYDYDEDDYNHCEYCNGTGEVEEYEYTVEVPVDHGEKIGNLVELYLDLPNRSEN